MTTTAAYNSLALVSRPFERIREGGRGGREGGGRERREGRGRERGGSFILCASQAGTKQH